MAPAAKSGVRCLGVFPYANDLRLDAEDSLALDHTRRTAAPAGASIAIVRFPRLSNGTDFRQLSWADWIVTPSDQNYHFVILPGSKDTIADLAWMRERGLDRWVGEQHRRGATVIGVCGGFQMLGEVIRDPDGLESTAGTARGRRWRAGSRSPPMKFISASRRVRCRFRLLPGSTTARPKACGRIA